jgi:hypothetical protein
MRKKLMRAAVRALAREVTTRDLRAAAMMGAARWAGKQVARRTRGAALRYAGVGLAGAALALPVGMYVARKVRERKAEKAGGGRR